LEELNLDEHSITYFEVRCWELVLVCETLIVFLCRVNGFPELLVKLIEVGDEFLSMCRGKITLCVDCDARIVALIGEKG
jgi:hypothetical protein